VTDSGIQILSPGAVNASSRISRLVSLVAGSYAIIGGAVTLAGWAFDLPRLTDWNGESISMFANTAACAALGGIAVVLFNSGRGGKAANILTQVLGCVVAVVGALTLLEHLTGTNIGIDTVLFNRPWGQKAAMAPMRMGVPASMSCVLLGSALVLMTYGFHARRFATGLATVVVFITSLSLVGYWFGADQLFGIARWSGIAWQTSTMLAALGIGVMAAMPDRGIVMALARDDAGGTVLRRLIVPIIGIPLLFGWLRVAGQQSGLVDLAFGTAIRTLAEIVLLLWLLWWTANGISDHQRAARRAERALRESEQRYREIAAAANYADRRKDEFLATLAHELRNPLAPIGNALALMKHDDTNGDVRRQAQETIERQFGQMVRLVDDLLDVGRITRDKLELRAQSVELASIVHQAVETCRPCADEFHHAIRVDMPREPIWVHADPVRLGQVFSNLLNNACKFTEPGGTISIEVKRTGHEAEISVKDTGIGIAPEKISSIFEMFEQIDNRMERTRGGLGIGLTLVKRLVELHGGQIAARSAGIGRGSEFIVRLPIVAEAASRPTAAAAAAPTRKSQRILVTDDNRDAANSLAMLLRVNGHKVEVAYSGAEAIKKAEQVRPQVMLLDIGMPEMNGYEVCRAIRDAPWGKDIRIVALTGWGQDQDRRNTHEAGFDSHLVKPVDPKVLSEVLAGDSSPTETSSRTMKTASELGADGG
jgi:signal transduction histidine kinase/ActR/RegA family two-component response regulator